MTPEERAARLAAMSSDAAAFDEEARRRSAAATAAQEAEEARMSSRKLPGTDGAAEPVAFIHALNQNVYSGSHETLAERLNKNKHYRQKGAIDQQKFI